MVYSPAHNERYKDSSGVWHVGKEPQPIGKGSYSEMQYRKGRDAKRDVRQAKGDKRSEDHYQEGQKRRDADTKYKRGRDTKKDVREERLDLKGRIDARRRGESGERQSMDYYRDRGQRQRTVISSAGRLVSGGAYNIASAKDKIKRLSNAFSKVKTDPFKNINIEKSFNHGFGQGAFNIKVPELRIENKFNGTVDSLVGRVSGSPVKQYRRNKYTKKSLGKKRYSGSKKRPYKKRYSNAKKKPYKKGYVKRRY